MSACAGSSTVYQAKVGEKIRTTTTITDYDGDAATPATFVVQVRDPSGNVAVFTHPDGSITTPSANVFEFVTQAFGEAGIWTIEHHSTDPSRVHAIKVRVRAQAIP